MVSSSLALLGIVCGVFWAEHLKAQDAKPTELQVKAAYLSNFGRFVEWPDRESEDPVEPFRVCVLGRDPFGSVLDKALAGEAVNRAPLTLLRISIPQEAVNCRVLFISSAENSELNTILAALDKACVLTVSDMPQFVKRGGMIQFVSAGGRVRFEVNLAAAERVRLKLSSQLLKLAIAVRRAP